MNSYEVLPPIVDRKTLLQCEFSDQGPTWEREGGGLLRVLTFCFTCIWASRACPVDFPELSLQTGGLREM